MTLPFTPVHLQLPFDNLIFFIRETFLDISLFRVPPPQGWAKCPLSTIPLEPMAAAQDCAQHTLLVIVWRLPASGGEAGTLW